MDTTGHKKNTIAHAVANIDFIPFLLQGNCQCGPRQLRTAPTADRKI